MTGYRIIMESRRDAGIYESKEEAEQAVKILRMGRRNKFTFTVVPVLGFDYPTQSAPKNFGMRVSR